MCVKCDGMTTNTMLQLCWRPQYFWWLNKKKWANSKQKPLTERNEVGLAEMQSTFFLKYAQKNRKCFTIYSMEWRLHALLGEISGKSDSERFICTNLVRCLLFSKNMFSIPKALLITAQNEIWRIEPNQWKNRWNHKLSKTKNNEKRLKWILIQRHNFPFSPPPSLAHK